jgi:hypothetical protein
MLSKGQTPYDRIRGVSIGRKPVRDSLTSYGIAQVLYHTLGDRTD